MNISKNHYIFSMDKNNAPALKVKDGDRFTVETMDCFSDTIQSADDTVGAIDFSRVNPATGPIYIEGAQPGDTLKVSIHHIHLAKQAVSVCLPDLGLMGDRISQGRTVMMSVADDHLIYRNKQLPLRKMIGVIGTAPEKQAVETGTPDQHGGNMDCTEVAEGHHIYLPVNVEGALLALGDLHAAMGDGELGGAGAEIAGEVDLSVEVLKDFPASLPMVETPTHWMTIGTHEEMKAASRNATEKMLDFLLAQPVNQDLDFEEAVILLSLFADVKVCQLVNPKVSMRVELAKDFFK